MRQLSGRLTLASRWPPCIAANATLPAPPICGRIWGQTFLSNSAPAVKAGICCVTKAWAD